MAHDSEIVVGASSPRVQSLLAYLLLHRGVPQSRQYISFALWPESTEPQARNNLRQLLHQIRNAIPDIDSLLDADASTLCWHQSGAFTLDVADFEHALDQAETSQATGDQHSRIQALKRAAELYRADLLPNCYDEWIVAERERLRQSYNLAAETLIELLEMSGDAGAAIPHAQRMLQFEPLNETTYRTLMRLHTLNNDRASALRVYHSCTSTLQRELGVEPDPATRAAYEQLLHMDAAHTAAHEYQPMIESSRTLIGRDPEWQRLQSVWKRVVAGKPHVVLISGEAGVGKSRLAAEMVIWAKQQGAIVAQTRCYAAEGQLTLAPVSEWLRSNRLSAHLSQLDDIWLTEVARLLPELLVEHPALPQYAPITEYGQRQRFFEALARATIVPNQPLLFMIDDLQWCDQETLDWLHFLLRYDPQAPLLLIGTARAEELNVQHPLRTLLRHARSVAGVEERVLEPFDAAESVRLAEQIAGHALGIDAGMRLFHETEGNPLFVVETIRANVGNLLTSKHNVIGHQDSLHGLTPRVYEVIAGRLAHLSPSARTLVQLAAIIGREFSFDMLVYLDGGDEQSVVHALDELWHKRIVREHGANSYDFTHDKLREVAYAEIGAPQRRRLHFRVAQALETLHAHDLDATSGRIAFHYERAGLPEQALSFYERAATQAQSIYANEEAISLLSRGLSLLEHLPISAKRDMQELNLLLALAPLYRITKGWTAPELEQTLERANELCNSVGDETQRTQILYGLQSMFVVQAKLDRVLHQIFNELKSLYQRAHQTEPPQFARLMEAGARMHRGRVTEANTVFQNIIAAYDPQQLQQIQESQGINYAAHAQIWHAHGLWLLGYPQQALDHARTAFELTQSPTQRFNEALVSTYLATLHQLCSDTSTAKAYAEEALKLTDQYKAPYYHAWSAILWCYALADENPDSANVQSLRDAIDVFAASGARLRLPYYLALLAQVYGHAGQASEGLTVLDEAMAYSNAHNECWWDPELYRLRGILLLASGAAPHAVEDAYLRAITIASAQETRSLELRATTDLARLWHQQGHNDEARRRLNECYSWFSEGFDTPDLRAAKAQLHALN